MNIATLSGVDVPSRRFFYTLSEPYLVERRGLRYEYVTSIFEVFSREGFTKVWCLQHKEIVKTLGRVSHESVLDDLGYIRAVDFNWLTHLTDLELDTCIVELDETGDDIDMFLEELDRR